MSVRECALIQTFPLEFEFFGSLGNMYKQIGNAVPVLMANKIAQDIKRSLVEFDKNAEKNNLILNQRADLLRSHLQSNQNNEISEKINL